MTDITDQARLIAIELALEEVPLIMLWRRGDELAPVECGGPDNCGREAEWSLAVAVESVEPDAPIEMGRIMLCSMCVGVLVVRTVDEKMLVQDDDE